MWKFLLGAAAGVAVIEVARRRKIKLPFGVGGCCGKVATPNDAPAAPTPRPQATNATPPGKGGTVTGSKSSAWDAGGKN